MFSLISCSFFALLILAFGTFAPALEAVNGGSQKEAGHDGRYGHGDAREDDDEEVGEGQGDLTLPETVLGELTERHTAAIGGQRALHTLYTCKRTEVNHTYFLFRICAAVLGFSCKSMNTTMQKKKITFLVKVS